MSAMDLQGKTAVITGATGKLGSEIALELARQGCNCVCHYCHSTQKADILVEKIHQMGVKAISVCVDLVNAKSYEGLFNLPDGFDRPTILINSASIFERAPLSDLSRENLEQTLNLNVAAPMLLAREFVAGLDLENMANKPSAKIVNITDVAEKLCWANYSVYCASKAALVCATRCLAKELAPEVTVNALSPGIVSWPSGFEDTDKLYQLSKIPAGRKADYREITSGVVYLLQNDYMTGNVLDIDGGRSI